MSQKTELTFALPYLICDVCNFQLVPLSFTHILGRLPTCWESVSYIVYNILSLNISVIYIAVA